MKNTKPLLVKHPKKNPRKKQEKTKLDESKTAKLGPNVRGLLN